MALRVLLVLRTRGQGNGPGKMWLASSRAAAPIGSILKALETSAGFSSRWMGWMGWDGFSG